MSLLPPVLSNLSLTEGLIWLAYNMGVLANTGELAKSSFLEGKCEEEEYLLMLPDQQH